MHSWINIKTCKYLSVSHPESSGVEHFGVFGEMHLHAAVLANRHGQLLQSFVSTVRTENFVRVTGRPEIQKHFQINNLDILNQ